MAAQDPRFTALQEFGKRNKDVAEDPVFQLVDKLFQVAPGVLCVFRLSLVSSDAE